MEKQKQQQQQPPTAEINVKRRQRSLAGNWIMINGKIFYGKKKIKK